MPTSVTQNTEKILEKCLKKVSKPTEKILKELYGDQTFHYLDLLTAPIYVALSGTMPEAKYFQDYFSAITILSGISLFPRYVQQKDVSVSFEDLQKFTHECQKVVISVLKKEEKKQAFLRYIKVKNFEKFTKEIQNWLILRSDLSFLVNDYAFSLGGSNQIIEQQCTFGLRSANILAEGISLMALKFRSDAMFSVGTLLRAAVTRIWEQNGRGFLDKLILGKISSKELHFSFGLYTVVFVNEHVPLAGIEPVEVSEKISPKEMEKLVTLAKRFSLRPILQKILRQKSEENSLSAAIEDFQDLMKDFSESSHRKAARNYIEEVMEELSQAD